MSIMKFEKEIVDAQFQNITGKLREAEEMKKSAEDDLYSLQSKYFHLENQFDVNNEHLSQTTNKLVSAEYQITSDCTSPHNGSSLKDGRQKNDESMCSNHRGSTEISTSFDSFSMSGCHGVGLHDGLSNSDDVKKPRDEKKKTNRKKKSKRDKEFQVDADSLKEERRNERRKSKRTESKKCLSSKYRPDPEGGNQLPITEMTEFEKIIYSREPLFSDVYQPESGETIDRSLTRRTFPECQRSLNATKSTSGIIKVCSHLSINSNTMIKHSIISTELHNIKEYLRRV